MLKPIKIKNLELKNRVIFPPMTTGYEFRGQMTDKSINFYEGLAKGGVSLIILGDVAPVKTLSPIPMLDSDEAIPGFKKLADAVHKHGTYIAAQVFHPEYDPVEIFRLFQAGDMASLRQKLHHDMAHFVNEVSVEKLQQIKALIVASAKRAAKAGFDMIQVHGDRLVGALSSPILNKRTDEYGGSLENRMRFGIEIVKAIRTELPEIAIDYKLALIKTYPQVGKGGPTIEEAALVAKWLVEAGVDSFHACQANHSSVDTTIPPGGAYPFMTFSDYAKAVKDAVNVPVAAVGRIVTPAHARYVLDNNYCDIVAIGRAMIADNEWVNKVAAGKEDEIRFCIMCNKGCTDKITGRSYLQCAINGAIGIDEKFDDTEPKNVMVIGGGPGGVEAAIQAAKRGHTVSLNEESDKLGGQLNIATVPKHKEEMNQILKYQLEELARQNVQVNLNTTVNAELLEESKPEQVVLATGANPTAFVLDTQIPTLSAWEALAGAKTGNKVLIVGGGSVGVETADFLSREGKVVSIVEMTKNLANGESPTIKPFILRELHKLGVHTYLETVISKTENNTVYLENGKTVTIEVDTIVYAVGAQKVDSLIEVLNNLDIPYEVIGDAKEPRLLENAIREGYFVANKI